MIVSNNKFNIVGVLKDADVNAAVSPRTGKSYVSVHAIIESLLEGVKNSFDVEFFTGEKKKDGSDNPFYNTYANIKTMIGSTVSVQGELRENRFYSVRTGQSVSTQRLNGVFVHSESASTPHAATFELGGFVLGELSEVSRTHEDGLTSELIRYDLKLGQPNYNGTSMQAFHVSALPSQKEIIKGLSGYRVGQTINVWGNLRFTVEQKIVENKNAGFGAAMPKTYINHTRNYIVLGGSNPITGDQAYTDADIKKWVESYKAYDKTLQEQALKKETTSDTQGLDDEDNGAAALSNRTNSLI